MELVLRALRRLARRLPQVVAPHHDALAVEAQDQEILLARRRFSRLRPVVERVEVLRRPLHQFLRLPLRQPGTGVAFDGLHRRVERAPRRLDGCQPSQPVRVQLLRQVQRCVERAQAPVAARPIGHSHRRHQPEHRQETARPTAVVRALDVIHAPHRSLDLLVGCTQVQMPLQEPAVDLPPLGGDERLQLAVRHPQRLRGCQPRHQLGELLLRGSERLLKGDRLCFHALGALSKWHVWVWTPHTYAESAPSSPFHRMQPPGITSGSRRPKRSAPNRLPSDTPSRAYPPLHLGSGR